MLFNQITLDWNFYLNSIKLELSSITKNEFASVQTCMPIIDQLSKINSVLKREKMLAEMNLHNIENHIIAAKKMFAGRMTDVPPIFVDAENKLNNLKSIEAGLAQQKEWLEEILNAKLELFNYELSVADMRCEKFTNKLGSLKKQLQIFQNEKTNLKIELENLSKELRSEVKRWYEQQDYFLTKLNQIQNNILVREKILQDFQYCKTEKHVIDEFNSNLERFKQDELYVEAKLSECGKALVKLNLTKKSLYQLFDSLKDSSLNASVKPYNSSNLSINNCSSSMQSF